MTFLNFSISDNQNTLEYVSDNKRNIFKTKNDSVYDELMRICQNVKPVHVSITCMDDTCINQDWLCNFIEKCTSLRAFTISDATSHFDKLFSFLTKYDILNYAYETSKINIIALNITGKAPVIISLDILDMLMESNNDAFRAVTINKMHVPSHSNFSLREFRDKLRNVALDFFDAKEVFYGEIEGPNVNIQKINARILHVSDFITLQYKNDVLKLINREMKALQNERFNLVEIGHKCNNSNIQIPIPPTSTLKIFVNHQQKPSIDTDDFDNIDSGKYGNPEDDSNHGEKPFITVQIDQSTIIHIKFRHSIKADYMNHLWRGYMLCTLVHFFGARKLMLSFNYFDKYKSDAQFIMKRCTHLKHLEIIGPENMSLFWNNSYEKLRHNPDFSYKLKSLRFDTPKKITIRRNALMAIPLLLKDMSLSLCQVRIRASKVQTFLDTIENSTNHFYSTYALYPNNATLPFQTNRLKYVFRIDKILVITNRDQIKTNYSEEREKYAKLIGAALRYRSIKQSVFVMGMKKLPADLIRTEFIPMLYPPTDSILQDNVNSDHDSDWYPEPLFENDKEDMRAEGYMDEPLHDKNYILVDIENIEEDDDDEYRSNFLA